MILDILVDTWFCFWLMILDILVDTWFCFWLMLDIWYFSETCVTWFCFWLMLIFWRLLEDIDDELVYEGVYGVGGLVEVGLRFWVGKPLQWRTLSPYVIQFWQRPQCRRALGLADCEFGVTSDVFVLPRVGCDFWGDISGGPGMCTEGVSLGTTLRSSGRVWRLFLLAKISMILDRVVLTWFSRNVGASG